jgi:GH24 family phage-related lysozyme (muramidase)
MVTSEKGLHLIKSFEGWYPDPYVCPAGKWTIGYGHLIASGEHFDTITEEEGEALLERDLLEAEGAVDILVKVELNQNQFDALVSFTFNLGSGNLSASTLLRLLNKRDYDGAADQFLRWIYAAGRPLEGLRRRREAERKLFLETVQEGGEIE